MTKPDHTSVATPFLENGGACGAMLRAMDWSQHPLGPPDLWPATLQTTISIVLGSRQPMLVCWGPQFHTLYNDGYALVCGQRHPAALGKPFSEIWYDLWDFAGPLIAQVLVGESFHMDEVELLMHRNGYPEETHFSFSYTPLRDAAGLVVGMFCACAETTEQVLLRRDLDHERAKLGQIFEQAPSFIVKMHGPDHVIEMANPAYVRLIGRHDSIGKPVAVALPEVADQGYIDLLTNVLATGEDFRSEGALVSLQRTPGGPLEDRYVDFVYQAVRETGGAITGVIATGIDVTERTLSQSALKNSEHFLRSVINASPDCIKVLDLAGRITFISDRGRKILEIPDTHQIEGQFWPDLWPEPARAQVLDALAQARLGASSRLQGAGDTLSGNSRYWDVRTTPMPDAQGRPERILAVSRDITYLRRIEVEREHLMDELSHRLKNVFGMVQSVINQTLRQAVSLEDGREILTGRVRALASAQDILSKSLASEMQISEVVEAALVPHRTGEGRFRVAGPQTTINGRQGLGLSLALHELATNATKYGALSGDHGQVSIGWATTPDGKFTFDWQESGGPQVTAPVQAGFGSVLIEKIVATYFDGSATLDFRPTGVVFHLTGTIPTPDTGDAPDPY